MAVPKSLFRVQMKRSVNFSKYERKIVKIFLTSLLRAEILTIFRSYFGRNNDLINWFFIRKSLIVKKSCQNFQNNFCWTTLCPTYFPWPPTKKNRTYIYASSLNIYAQSICSHYSCFENMDRFVTLKKSSPKYGPEKSRVQKTGSWLFKKKRGRQAAFFLFEDCLFSFWITMTLLFSGPYFGLRPFK